MANIYCPPPLRAHADQYVLSAIQLPMPDCVVRALKLYAINISESQMPARIATKEIYLPEYKQYLSTLYIGLNTLTHIFMTQ